MRLITTVFLLSFTIAFSQEKTTLKSKFAEDFKIGAAVNPAIVNGQNKISQDIVIEHFNSITVENVMKAEVVNPILYGKSLGQQYMVDQFAKVELSRLTYIENHQKELRAEFYSGAKDAMKSDGKDLKDVGKKVIILPSSFMS